jgi:hypothetical protein
MAAARGAVLHLSRSQKESPLAWGIAALLVGASAQPRSVIRGERQCEVEREPGDGRARGGDLRYAGGVAPHFDTEMVDFGWSEVQIIGGYRRRHRPALYGRGEHVAGLGLHAAQIRRVVCYCDLAK